MCFFIQCRIVFLLCKLRSKYVCADDWQKDFINKIIWKIKGRCFWKSAVTKIDFKLVLICKHSLKWPQRESEITVFPLCKLFIYLFYYINLYSLVRCSNPKLNFPIIYWNNCFINNTLELTCTLAIVKIIYSSDKIISSDNLHLLNPAANCSHNWFFSIKILS